MIGALLVLTAGGGLAYAQYTAAQTAEAELHKSAQALKDCLLRGPLDEPETPLLRFRRLQLEAISLPDAEIELKRDQVWPLACKDQSLKLKERQEEERAEALSNLTDFVASTSSRFEDPTRAMLPAFEIIEQIVPGAAHSTKSEKLTPSVLNVNSLSKIKSLSPHGTALSRSYTEENPGLSLPVLIAEENLKAPVLCQFSKDAAAECQELSGLSKVSGHGLRLLGTSDENSKTLIFAGRRGSEGVYVAGEDKPIESIYSYGGYASKSGAAGILGWRKEKREAALILRNEAGQVRETALNPNFRVGNYFYNAQLMWDNVVVRGITPDNQRRLFTMPIEDSSGRDFSMADVGELSEPGWVRNGEEEQPHITGCRSKNATILRVRGRHNDFLTFRVGSDFTMPVYGPTWGVLGCHGSTATMTTAAYAKKGTKVLHSVCTSAGCKRREFEASALDRDSTPLRPVDARDVHAVDLAGRILVVWKAGDRGGLRMRLAEPDLFEQTQDVIIFDDLVSENGLSDMSSILGFRLYSREDFAVLMMSTMAGLYAFHISPDGEIEPFQLKKSSYE